MEQRVETKELVPVNAEFTLSAGANVQELVARAKIVDQVYRQIMKKDIHYGVIPGTSGKPSLLKPGAEKLCSVFNLGCDPVIEVMILPEGHINIRVLAMLKHNPSQTPLGGGVGSCSTLESKYRYRNVADFEVTGEVIPDDSKEKKQEYRKQGFGMKLIDGVWEWVKYGDSEKSINPDIADVYNTILKMAKKRALIDAVLTVTAASDIFTQDVEDLVELRGALGLDEKHETSTNLERKKQVSYTHKKVEVVEGIEVWDVEISDVVEKKLQDGKPYYIVECKDGKSCGTINGQLAEQAASAEGEIRLEVRPGKKPGSFVLQKILAAQEPIVDR